MQDFLNTIFSKQDLTSEQATLAMEHIMEGKCNNSEIAAFLAALRTKGEAITEVAAFAEVMREKSAQINPDVEKLVDTCGTGGDHSGTFNISTCCAFVVAGAGVPVAKHGNRAASSKCGSADVLEKLGVKIDLLPIKVEQAIEKIGIGFLFAPSFHDSMKHVVPVRKELKVRTIFNILGPLTNPASTKNQVIGVYDPELTEFMAHILKRLGSQHAMVVHGEGLDEITTTGITKITELKDDEITSYDFDPTEYEIERSDINDLSGGTVAENAKIIESILKGETGPKRDIVVINSAAALIVSDKAHSWNEAIEIAKESIDSGSALDKLNLLKKFK